MFLELSYSITKRICHKNGVKSVKKIKLLDIIVLTNSVCSTEKKKSDQKDIDDTSMAL